MSGEADEHLISDKAALQDPSCGAASSFTCLHFPRKKSIIKCKLSAEVSHMLNFEEELAKFKPSLELKDTEETIKNTPLVDVTDILARILKDATDKE